MLHGPQRDDPAEDAEVGDACPCNAPAKAIHLLSGVGGLGFPAGARGRVSMIVRLHYADGTTEDHELKNGVHFADYVRREGRARARSSRSSSAASRSAT